MKPVYLEFCGLNSFSETAKIDFQSLLKGGVFGIFGDTGSGKSTILDAIHFALYGEVDRVPKSFADCINHRLDSATVTFDFELTVDGVRKTYRVKREKKRKQGASKAYLYEKPQNAPTSGWNALAESTRDVNDALEKIIGLTFDDFKTCIALPQGDFASLVKSTPAERVKLVARLFNLEKYGEKLTATVFARHKQAEEAVRLVQAKMGENAFGGAEQVDLLARQIASQKESIEKQKSLLEDAETALQKAEVLLKEKKTLEEAQARLQTLQAREAEMITMRDTLERLPKAKAVLEADSGIKQAQTAQSSAQESFVKFQALHAQKTEELANLRVELERENYDDKILQARLELSKVQSAKVDFQVAERAEKEYLACREEYKQLLKNTQSEDFDGKKAEIEKELTALGDDENLMDYLKHNYKECFLSDAYGEFRADLIKLSEKYPQAQAEIAPLLQKYTLSSALGEKNVELTTLNLAFKQMEMQKKQLKTRLEELETRRRLYEENESKKKLLGKQGELLKQNYLSAKEKIQEILALGSEETLSLRVQKLENKQNNLRKSIDCLAETIVQLYAKGERLQGVIGEQKKLEISYTERLQETLKAGGFASVEEANALKMVIGDENNEVRLKERLNAFFEELSVCKRSVAEGDTKKFDGVDENKLLSLREEKRVQKEILDGQNRALGESEREWKNLLVLREKYAVLEKELAEKQKAEKLLDELLKLVRGNRFLEYIASEYLQEICAVASKTLLSLTGGRYFLKYEEKEFKVGDNLDGGALRAVKTLSGGETFLVSLSLALSLSSAICMKSLRPIEFFFLDEGFGTLDEKLVDTVMDVLSKLGKSFSVGLISHVEELKRRIERKILVTPANESQGSKIKVISY